jgi:hypothetical protein
VAGLSRSPSSSWLLDPEVKEPVAFTDVTKMAECGLDNLLASLTPWSRIKRTVALILCWPARFRERKQRKAGIWKQEATASQPSPRITRFVVKKKGAAPREFEIEEPSPDELTLSVNRLVGRAQRIAYAPEFKVITRGIALERPLTKRLLKSGLTLTTRVCYKLEGALSTLPYHLIYVIRLCCRLRLWLASALYEPFTSRTRIIRRRGGRCQRCSVNTGLRLHAVSSVV